MTIHTVTTSPIFSKRIGEGHFWGLGSLAWNNQSPSSMPRLSFSLARCLDDFSARHSHHLVSETMMRSNAIQVMRRFQREVMTAVFFFFFSFSIKNGYFCQLFMTLPLVFELSNIAWRLLYIYIFLNQAFYTAKISFSQPLRTRHSCGIEKAN